MDCIWSLQEKLLAARDFKKWTFQKQIQYLNSELDKHKNSHDRESFKNYMEEFFCVTEQEYFDKYYPAMKDKLVKSICLKCRIEINPDEKSLKMGVHLLHLRCHKEILHKIRILQENGWEKTDKLDAYFDLLRIEKAVRPAISTIGGKRRKIRVVFSLNLEE